MHRAKVFVDPESLTIVAKFFIVFAISYAFAVSVAFHFVVDEWKIYAKNSITVIERSDQASITDVCEIMSCTYIKIDDTVIYRDANNEFTETKHESSGFEVMFDTIVAIPVENNSKEVIFGLSIMPLIKFYLDTVLVLYVFLMVLSLVFLIRYLISSNIKSLVNGASNTASLHNKNMSMLAEQLHHELNTPLSVVKELCDKVFAFMEEASACNASSKGNSPYEDSTMPSRYSDMAMLKLIIDNNIRQAFVFIERMADVKQIRYSNGNKSIYDIVKASFDIMGVYNRSNYTYDIDVSLKKLRIDHSSKLKNHALMNILLNHIKNSLEAGSSHIIVSLNKVVPHEMNRVDKLIHNTINTLSNYSFGGFSSGAIIVLYRLMSSRGQRNITVARLTLIDNGSGVPPEFQDKIFNLNSSTKSKDGVIRGAGLYLNREILRDSMGDLWLYKTSPRGTTFILDVPAEHIASIKKYKKDV